jgi:hypothetical protein
VHKTEDLAHKTVGLVRKTVGRVHLPDDLPPEVMGLQGDTR